MISRPFHGMNLSDAKKVARQLGCDISTVSGTGDVRFKHHSKSESVRQNNRRKDASRALTNWLIKVYECQFPDGEAA